MGVLVADKIPKKLEFRDALRAGVRFRFLVGIAMRRRRRPRNPISIVE
jgi:hypothetical protein